MTAEEIVRLLAADDPMVDDRESARDYCQFCGREEEQILIADQDPKLASSYNIVVDHRDLCPYRLAVEYVQEHERPG